MHTIEYNAVIKNIIEVYIMTENRSQYINPEQQILKYHFYICLEKQLKKKTKNKRQLGKN